MGGRSEGTAPQNALLMEALDHLALPAEKQIEYLVSLGTAPLADELALEFDDHWRAATVAAPAWACLAELDRHLDAMSGSAHAALWTLDALRTGGGWEAVRRPAQRALDALRGS